MSDTTNKFAQAFPADMTLGLAEHARIGATCYLGSATAWRDGPSGECVIVIARTRASLANFIEANLGKPADQDRIFPVAMLHQKNVKVVDDL